MCRSKAAKPASHKNQSLSTEAAGPKKRSKLARRTQRRRGGVFSSHKSGAEKGIPKPSVLMCRKCLSIWVVPPSWHVCNLVRLFQWLATYSQCQGVAISKYCSGFSLLETTYQFQDECVLMDAVHPIINHNSARNGCETSPRWRFVIGLTISDRVPSGYWSRYWPLIIPMSKYHSSIGPQPLSPAIKNDPLRPAAQLSDRPNNHTPTERNSDTLLFPMAWDKTLGP